MFRRQLLAAAIVATAGAVGMTGMEFPAQAASVPIKSLPAGNVILDEGNGFQQVRHSRKHRQAQRYNQRQRWRYNRARHGQRYRSRRGNYVHYYNGYYYSRPWWTIGIPGIVIQID